MLTDTTAKMFSVPNRRMKQMPRVTLIYRPLGIIWQSHAWQSGS